ncbi:MAG: hypothetical protein FJW39_32040 [Acidobacteria bacterium]|nr:hypothetical protein [Acidobacteriota bacterium]
MRLTSRQGIPQLNRCPPVTLRLCQPPTGTLVKDVSGSHTWRDTININRGRTVRLRMRFADFPGRSLYHCHSLVHEDNSMMQILEIGE